MANLPLPAELTGNDVTEAQFKDGLNRLINGVSEGFTENQSISVLESNNALKTLSSEYKNLADRKISGYISKSTGLLIPNASWYATPFIAITSTSKVVRDGVIIGDTSNGCSLAFYDANKIFLGYYIDNSAIFNVKPLDIYPDAKFIRLSYQSTSNTKIYLYEPSVTAFIDEYLIPYIGKPSNVAGPMTVGYVTKTDGSLVALAGWGVTDYIAVDATSIVTRDADPVATTSAVAPIACYDTNKNYLGYIQNIDRAEKLKIGRKFPTVKFIRMSVVSNSTYALYIQTQAATNLNEQVKALDIFNSDFFTSADTLKGYVKLDGAFVASDTWITSPLVPCKLNQKFKYTGRGNAGLVSNVSLYDKNGKFLESIYAATNLATVELTIVNANAKFIRACAATAYSFSFTGIELAKSTSKQYSTIVPDAVYALKNEPIYLYADGIVGNADNVAWNISGSNQRVCKVVPTTSASIPIKLQTTEDLNNKKVLAEFNVLVTDTPVNPSAKRYIIALGDSLTDGKANSNIQGAWVNECSRRLNGVGYQLLSPELSPAPLGMTNLEFIGTLGNNAVKHEGRGGWAAKDYLTLPNINDVTNAFWNPSTSQFDLNYYLSQNGFTGVNATGSNLTVIILLGWNDVYDPTSSPTQSAADLSNLIDKIKSTHPDVDFICLGLNQAPDLMFKTFTGTRYVSKREVFESIKAFNDAYKAMIATKTKVDFLQISCTFCSEIGYNTTITDPNTDPTKRDPTWHRLSARSVTQLEAVDDHIHPNKEGYAMIADAVCYKVLYKYCRGA
ncbi:TPA: SGNH/GDSL hydrolase family protein [Acinetobacter baumannii]|nr:SGNH/GDSL hydrolase family protein [Acinetobacter baumannii]